ncbi:unnamed protein product [Linum trigynum]|uniref:DUF3444 domain-containing protein n=1 Tax=Linum trigynum TaxID=586398 RepID=A0AAV2GS98_9ROSI
MFSHGGIDGKLSVINGFFNWALYRNRSHSMLQSELPTCDYDVVEVVERNDLQIRVLHLERVKGFNSVFRAQAEKEGSAVVVNSVLPPDPCSLRGLWELDIAAFQFAILVDSISFSHPAMVAIDGFYSSGCLLLF